MMIHIGLECRCANKYHAHAKKVCKNDTYKVQHDRLSSSCNSYGKKDMATK
jgi:hypothetical protein